MTGDDVDRTLRALNRRRPFRAFFIELNSGDRLHVRHPEVVNRSGELFVYYPPDLSHRIFSGNGIAQFIDPPPD